MSLTFENTIFLNTSNTGGGGSSTEQNNVVVYVGKITSKVEVNNAS